MEQFAELGCVCLLILLTRLKQGWINSGIIKILYKLNIKAQLQGTGSCSECLYEES